MKTAQYLKQCRERLKVPSNYQLAKHWKITQTALSAYENERRMPDMRTRLLIAETLGIPVEQLIKDPDLERPRMRKHEGREHSTAAALVATVLLSLMGGALISDTAQGHMPNDKRFTNYATFRNLLRYCISRFAGRIAIPLQFSL